jgi:hypothetical protein
MATELVRSIIGTRPDIGKMLRRQWLNAHDVECEPLTFGDLKEGDKFISMPIPGDNSGHGGLLGGSYLFMKINLITTPTMQANAIRLFGGFLIRNYDQMLVLKIE